MPYEPMNPYGPGLAQVMSQGAQGGSDIMARMYSGKIQQAMASQQIEHETKMKALDEAYRQSVLAHDTSVSDRTLNMQEQEQNTMLPYRMQNAAAGAAKTQEEALGEHNMTEIGRVKLDGLNSASPEDRQNFALGLGGPKLQSEWGRQGEYATTLRTLDDTEKALMSEWGDVSGMNEEKKRTAKDRLLDPKGEQIRRDPARADMLRKQIDDIRSQKLELTKHGSSGMASRSAPSASQTGQGGGASMGGGGGSFSNADIEATARATGLTPSQVVDKLKAKGLTYAGK